MKVIKSIAEDAFNSVERQYLEHPSYAKVYKKGWGDLRPQNGHLPFENVGRVYS